MPNIDLHMHSSYSPDGEIPPAQLVSMAKRAGMEHIAIADHNTSSAVAEALIEGKKRGICVIPGIEIDCLYQGIEVHLLGLYIDHLDIRYQKLWDDIESQEREMASTRIKLVQGLGIHIDGKAVMAKAKNGIVTAELLAEVALADPRNGDNPLLSPFRPGGARDDNPFVNFYWDYCSPGKPASVKISIMPLRKAVELVVDTGGVPVIAHPEKSLEGNRDKLPGILAEGVRGIEAFCSYHSPDDSAYWHNEAEKAGVLFTCGSDFHGKTKPAIKIGGHGGQEWSDLVMANLKNAAWSLSKSPQ
jgi:Predicted metal-dependent phosphoesterases (PHP family)